MEGNTIRIVVENRSSARDGLGHRIFLTRHSRPLRGVEPLEILRVPRDKSATLINEVVKESAWLDLRTNIRSVNHDSIILGLQFSECIRKIEMDIFACRWFWFTLGRFPDGRACMVCQRRGDYARDGA